MKSQTGYTPKENKTKNPVPPSETSETPIHDHTGELMQDILPLCININSFTKHRVRYDMLPLLDGKLVFCIYFFENGVINYYKSKSWTIYPHWEDSDKDLKEVYNFLEKYTV